MKRSDELTLVAALEILGFALDEPQGLEREVRWIGHRKGAVYQIRRLSDDRILCTYSTVDQIKNFLIRKIGGQ